MSEDESARQFLISCENTPAADESVFKSHLAAWLQKGGEIPSLVHVVRTERSVHQQHRLLDRIKSAVLEIKSGALVSPEVPRVTFNDDGESMNLSEAVEKFKKIMAQYAIWSGRGTQEFTLTVQVRPCDCEDDISGRDSGCPLHGDGS